MKQYLAIARPSHALIFALALGLSGCVRHTVGEEDCERRWDARCDLWIRYLFPSYCEQRCDDLYDWVKDCDLEADTLFECNLRSQDACNPDCSTEFSAWEACAERAWEKTHSEVS